MFDTDEELRHAAHHYRLERGWTTSVHGSQLALELDDDILGLQMPSRLAEDLVAALHSMRLSCPVIDLPGNRVSVVLLEPTERQQSPAFPACVGALPHGHRVPLPPSTTAQGPVRWLARCEPDTANRPSVRTVADALANLT
jgi:hypothetical protein